MGIRSGKCGKVRSQRETFRHLSGSSVDEGCCLLVLRPLKIAKENRVYNVLSRQKRDAFGCYRKFEAVEAGKGYPDSSRDSGSGSGRFECASIPDKHRISGNGGTSVEADKLLPWRMTHAHRRLFYHVQIVNEKSLMRYRFIGASRYYPEYSQC